ncbi:hypothetical protein LIER_11342 [Lithospermum erythrorhizon]|uniref:RNase H type-1 domain-containing protein n=1 Tax=Lithospermum erythrorhizon TaxID=34254 RepID=A0AAV3PS16_LITER
MYPWAGRRGTRVNQPSGGAEQRVWLLYVDGASSPGSSGAGILLFSPEGQKIRYAVRFAFAASNNEAEYKGLASGLLLANSFGEKHIHIRMDS